MIKTLLKILPWAVVFILVLAQQDEFGNNLVDGYYGLKLLLILSSVMMLQAILGEDR